MAIGIIVTLRNESQAGFQQVNSALRTLKAEGQGANVSMMNLGRGLGIVGFALTSTLTPMLAAAGQIGVSMADIMQRGELAFTTILGSADKAKAMLQNLANFATATPFQIRDLIPLAQRLMTVGFSAQNVIPLLQGLGDAISAVGGNQANLDAVVATLGKIETQGKVTAIRMNQLAAQSIPAWQILADEMGKTIPELRAMITAGEVDSKTAIEALIDGIEHGTKNVKSLGGMMQEMSKLASGALSNLKDAADLALGALMDPVLKAFADVVNQLIPYVMALVQVFKEMDAPTKMFIVGIGAVLAGIGPLTFALAGMAIAMSFLLGPIGLVVLGIEALILASGLAAAAFISNWNGVRDRFGPILADIGKVLVDMGVQALTWGANFVVMIANGMASAVHFITEVMATIANILAFWLAPGSDPKIAPFSEWGHAWVDQLMSGFSKVDFAVFDEIAKQMETQLRDAFSGGAKFNLLDAIMGSREGLAQAMDDLRQYGEIGADAMNKILSAMAPVGGAMQDQISTYAGLIRATWDLQNATEALNDASRTLNGLQRQLREMDQPLDREIQQLQMQRKLVEDQIELERLGKQKNVTPADAEKAALDIKIRQLEVQKDQNALALGPQMDAAQKAKDDAQDAKDKAEEQKAVYQGQLDTLTGIGKVIAENTKLLDEFHKAAGGGGAGAKGGIGGVGGQPDLKGLLLDANAQTQALKDKWNELTGESGPFARLKGVWDILQKGLPNPFESMVTSVETLITRIETAIGLANKPQETPSAETGASIGAAFSPNQPSSAIQGAVMGLVKNIGGFLEEFAKLELHTALKLFKVAVDAVTEILGGAIKGALNDLNIAMGGESGTIDKLNKINATFVEMKEFAKTLNDRYDDNAKATQDLTDSTKKARTALDILRGKADSWNPPTIAAGPQPVGEHIGPGFEGRPIGPVKPDTGAYTPDLNPDGSAIPRASGGSIYRGGLYQVHRDELIIGGTSGQVLPKGKWGNTNFNGGINLSVNVQGNADKTVIDQLKGVMPELAAQLLDTISAEFGNRSAIGQAV